MQTLLRCSRAIDTFSEWLADKLIWLVLIMTLLTAATAVARKLSIGTNALMDLQWYLFAAIFLLSAGYALLRNAHVRIDVLMGRFGPKVAAWMDIFGTLFFLLPFTFLVIYTSWPFFMGAWHSNESSGNPGALVFWPARLLIPIGFALLTLQALSEMVKRIGVLTGHLSATLPGQAEANEELALAEEIRRMRGLDEEGAK